MKKLLIVWCALSAATLISHAQNLGKDAFENIKKVNISIDEVDVSITRISGNRLIIRENTGASVLHITSSEGTLDIRQHTSVGLLSRTPILNIEVPENINFYIRMKDGELKLDQVVGTFMISNSEGDITATVSPIGTSYIESESGTVKIKLMDGLAANLHVGAGSGRGTIDFAKHPINAKVKMESFYPSGSIKAPFEFKEVHITRSYGPDTIVKLIEIGSHEHQLSLSTGGGTIQIIQ